nr:MAG TPA: Hepatitis C virus non-structural 5a protein membrane anchor [Inoviridae sp.]
MDVFGEIWNWICETLYDLLKSIIDLLPDSPFQMLDNSPISKYLVYINYFVDFQFIVDTLTLWLVAVAGYYTYSAILRMLNTID